MRIAKNKVKAQFSQTIFLSISLLAIRFKILLRIIICIQSIFDWNCNFTFLLYYVLIHDARQALFRLKRSRAIGSIVRLFSFNCTFQGPIRSGSEGIPFLQQCFRRLLRPIDTESRH